MARSSRCWQGYVHTALQTIWYWMRIHSATSISYGEHAVAHFMAVCLVYWTGQSHQWGHDACAARSRSRCLTWVNWRPAWRAWKNSTRAPRYAAALQCACRDWVTWSALLDVYAREAQSPTRRGRCGNTSN